MKNPKPPAHLSRDMKRFWALVVEEFELEQHHLRVLQAACEAWDRMSQARAALVEHGLSYTDRYGAPRARPECNIERDSRVSFLRALRELNLTATPADESRPPTIGGDD